MAAAAGDRLTHEGGSPDPSRAPRRTCARLVWALLVTASCAPGLSGRVAPAPASDAKAPAASPAVDPLAALRTWESAVRAQTDFARARTSDTALGADPYVIRRVASGDDTAGEERFVGILRGRSALVELDGALREVRRLPAPASPTGLAVATSGEIFVAGELSSRVARFRMIGGRIEAAGAVELSGVRAIRDVATGPEGVVYVVEEHDGRLITFQPGTEEDSAPIARVDTVLCHGPLHVLRIAQSVVVDCLLDHRVVIRHVDRLGFPEPGGEIRIDRDGPVWGVDAVSQQQGLLVATGGVEDHPLDRTQGSFGFIDSFVTLYSVADGVATKLSEVNASAEGVVTPKALKLSRLPSGVVDLVVAGYGSDRLAVLEWADPTGRAPPAIRVRSVPPGSAMMEVAGDGWRIANPLLDAWVTFTAAGTRTVAVDDEPARARTAESRLGEALFFTTLMAPWNRSDGRLSRFTCETCHFEGYVDGRTHRTGRGDVVATTKPLVGLFNNKPHFSRALDPDLTTMVNNEFRVAGAKSDHDPWFSLSVNDFPWTRRLGAQGSTLGPETLRRALMTFFMDFAPRPNPAVVGRTRWSAVERAGADVFRSRCESCHEARLVADDASTRVPFDAWEDLVMAPEGAIVWADAAYQRTGVTPYVNERGARVVSLRRLYKKYPYFTNGTAKGLGAVLDRAGFEDGRFLHDGASDSAGRLTDEEKAQLGAFLDLL